MLLALLDEAQKNARELAHECDRIFYPALMRKSLLLVEQLEQVKQAVPPPAKRRWGEVMRHGRKR